jgi:hypothetical protein
MGAGYSTVTVPQISQMPRRTLPALRQVVQSVGTTGVVVRRERLGAGLRVAVSDRASGSPVRPACGWREVSGDASGIRIAVISLLIVA